MASQIAVVAVVRRSNQEKRNDHCSTAAAVEDDDDGDDDDGSDYRVHGHTRLNEEEAEKPMLEMAHVSEGKPLPFHRHWSMRAELLHDAQILHVEKKDAGAVDDEAAQIVVADAKTETPTRAVAVACAIERNVVRHAMTPTAATRMSKMPASKREDKMMMEVVMKMMNSRTSEYGGVSQWRTTKKMWCCCYCWKRRG